MTKCPQTNKRRFKNENDAKISLNNPMKFSKRDNVPNRSYYCDLCKGFHLTKNAQKTGHYSNSIILAHQFEKYMEKGESSEDDERSVANQAK